MRIVVWGINYAPELTGIGPYNAALCEFLAEQGHNVQMVTGFPYYPEWQKHEADSHCCYRTDTLGKVPVHRCWLYIPRHVRTLQRIAHEASFVVTSFLRLISLPRPDLYIVISPPLLLGAAAAIAGLLKQVKFVFHVQDLQPDAALSLGMVKETSLVAKVLYGLEAVAYRAAAGIFVISPGMLRMLRTKGVPEHKLHFFPNSVSVPIGFPARGAFRKRHAISANAFVVLYSGNLGAKQGLSALLEAATVLNRRSPNNVATVAREIRFVIAGAGANREAVVDYVSRTELTNILLLPLQTAEEYHEMLVDADCCAITQQPGTGALFFPSKLLMTLAFGRPVLSVADEESDLAGAVRQGKFGSNITPGDVPGVLAVLDRWSKREVDLEELGRAGRDYVRRFESSTVLLAFEGVLRALHAESAGARQGAQP